ncbi:TRAP transporter large permease [Halomonas sp. HMF6819]|uniref:TRAP transporter large permease n=1 Tax=unclassified Halomonas TaxID=2609666 RepID=UPI0020766D35|nr:MULTISPECIES: TRAP transporter large permease [unclassified Halomonas]
MSPDSIMALVLVLVTFLCLLAIRFHVGLSLMLSGLIGVMVLRTTDAAISAVTNAPYTTSFNYSLVIIPLFILMGVLAVRAGLAQAGFDIASRLLAKFPGGAALSSLAGSGLFAAVTGSSVATVATLARVSTDAITQAGHHIRLAAGVVCAGGTLGVLIPPSIVLVLYGIITEESIGQLLLAGIGPGLLTIAAYASTIVVLVLFFERRSDHTHAASNTPSTKANAATPKSALDIMGGAYLFIIFMVSIGTIYLGIATPTEAASFGALAALIIFAIRVKFANLFSAIKEPLSETIGLTAMTFLLLTGAGVFTYFLALSGASTSLVNWVVSADLPPYGVLIICLLLLLPLGMFLDGISMILIAGPILHPILTSYGFDGIWLGVIIVKVAEMALVTPPVGMNVFVYSGTVKEIPISDAFKGVFPFIIADFVVVALLILVPGIVTLLPSLSGAS